MIETYVKNPEFVRAIKVEPTDKSIDECVGFVAPGATTRVTVDYNTGIMQIKASGIVMNAEFGNYIVKDAKNEFHVLSVEIFETRYTKVATEDLVNQSQERLKKWYEEQKA